MPPNASHIPNSPSDRYRKKQRLSHACDRCRARKVRCDEGQPACQRCVVSNAVCTTTESESGRSLPPESRHKTKTKARTDDAVRLMHNAHLSTPQPTSASPSPVTRDHPPDEVALNHVSPARTARATFVDHNSISSRHSAVSASNPFDSNTAMAVNVDNSRQRQQYLGPSSLQVMTQWLDITFSAYGVNRSFSSGFRHGMSHAVEMQLPLLPTFPVLNNKDAPIAKYFEQCNGVFPVLDRPEFMRIYAQLSSVADLRQLEPYRRPDLAIIYAVLGIGMDRLAGKACDQGSNYLEAAYSLLPHLLAMPYLPSVRALLLLVIALMCRNKEGSAYQIMASAIRICHSLGLHRCRPQAASDEVYSEKHSNRIWWIAYCLERKLCFESGRPAVIQDFDIDLSPDACAFPKPFEGMIDLARIQGMVSQLYLKSGSTTDPQDHFHQVAEVDARLLNLIDNIPEALRPSTNILYHSQEMESISILLACNFYQTMITVHRFALLFDNQIYERLLGQATITESASRRIRAGESICIESARSMLTLLNNAVQQQKVPVLLTLTLPLLAVYTLGISVIKHPKSWSAPMDQKLIETTSQYLRASYVGSGQTPAFVSMLEELQLVMSQTIEQAANSSGQQLQERFNEQRRDEYRNNSSWDSNSIQVSGTEFGAGQHADLSRNVADLEQTHMEDFSNYEMPMIFGEDFMQHVRSEDVGHFFGLEFFMNQTGSEPVNPPWLVR